MSYMRITAGLLTCAALASTLTAFATPQASATYEMVQRSRVCTSNPVDSKQLDCEFRVGKSLRFGIAGVGLADAGIVFSKSDIDGDFYAAFGLEHRCVIVWPGATTSKQSPGRSLDAAFVSPVDGKVYRDWRSCLAAKK
jgi:hypothetical protein